MLKHKPGATSSQSATSSPLDTCQRTPLNTVFIFQTYTLQIFIFQTLIKYKFTTSPPKFLSIKLLKIEACLFIFLNYFVIFLHLSSLIQMVNQLIFFFINDPSNFQTWCKQISLKPLNTMITNHSKTTKHHVT